MCIQCHNQSYKYVHIFTQGVVYNTSRHNQCKNTKNNCNLLMDDVCQVCCVLALMAMLVTKFDIYVFTRAIVVITIIRKLSFKNK
jgi:mannose/fructose/N-acetylgalactosamine-specific phosphotransferase system component IID